MKMNFSQLGQYQGNYLRNTIFLLHLNVKDEDVNYIKREQKTQSETLDFFYFSEIK